MTMSDPIADMLTRIRNANSAKHDTVDIPASKMKMSIAQILLDEGYVSKYDIIDDGSFKTIHITLKYGANKTEKVISGIKRISKPGLRGNAGKRGLAFMRARTSCPGCLAGWVSQSSLPTRALSPTRRRVSCRLEERFWRLSGNKVSQVRPGEKIF